MFTLGEISRTKPERSLGKTQVDSGAAVNMGYNKKRTREAK